MVSKSHTRVASLPESKPAEEPAETTSFRSISGCDNRQSYLTEIVMGKGDAGAVTETAIRSKAIRCGLCAFYSSVILFEALTLSLNHMLSHLLS